MRCPKCHYLSFDPEPRCRNCGYGFSLEDSDLFIRDEGGASEPLADLSLRPGDDDAPPAFWGAARAETQAAAAAAGRAAVVEEPRAVANPFEGLSGPVASRAAEPVPIPVPPVPSGRSAPTTELPLFVKGLSTVATDETSHSGEPLVTMPAEPRPPLAVRRKTSEASPARSRPASPAAPRKFGPLDRDLLADLQRLEKQERATAEAELRALAVPHRAGPAKRLAAAAVDASLLGALGAGVLWATLRWADLTLDRALMLPVLVPTTVFVVLLGVVYLLMFTAASGQTLGKMALGLRVVGDEPSPGTAGVLTVRQALLRALLTVPSVLVAGAGFVPALVGDERAVHDRIAHTRVVRA